MDVSETSETSGRPIGRIFSTAIAVALLVGLQVTKLPYVGPVFKILSRSPVPIGVVIAVLVIAYVVYRVGIYLRRRLRPGRVLPPLTPLHFVSGSDIPSTPPSTAPGPNARNPPDGIRIWESGQFRYAQDVWAAPSVSTPPPRKSAFVLEFIAAFLLTAFAILLVHRYLLFGYDTAVNNLGTLFYWPLKWPGVKSAANATLRRPLSDFIFLMFLSVLIALGFSTRAFAGNLTSRPGRGWRALGVLVLYIVVSMLTDTVYYTVRDPFYYSAFLVLRSFEGGAFFALMLLVTLTFPLPLRVRPAFRRDPGAVWVFFGTAAISIALSIAVLYPIYRFLGIGGPALPIGILLVFPFLAITIWGLLCRGIYDVQLRANSPPAVADYHPAVSIIIPAYNEELAIGRGIAAADQAARLYPGTTEIVVGNDGSTDRTFDVAREAMTHLQYSTGKIVDLPHGGKSNALNYALRAATGELVIRCDADSRISTAFGFAKIAPHFANSDVGGVQGLVLPLQRTGWTRKLRMMEITWNHLFLRRAQMATLTTQVLDGVFCAFRREDLLRYGGWVAWNGEDSEITLRFERAGYHTRFEPGAAAFEDVPANYDQLRRQRVRWNRGGLFAHRPHMGAVVEPALEYGGLALIYWFVLFARGGLRGIVYIWALLATLLLLPTLYHVAIIALLLLVPRGLVMAYYMVKMYRGSDLPWILFWPVASVIKQFYALEAYGTMLPGAAREFTE